MTIRLIIAYVLNLFDLAMTNHWINNYGLEIEGNPIGRWMYKKRLAVPVKVFGIGALMAGLYFALLAFPAWVWVSWVIMLAYVALTIYHIIVYIRVNGITKGGI